MKKRSPIAVLLLPFVTFGIYTIYWQVKTKGEMNKLGCNIPTAWLIIIPFVNLWWMWKYCEGVDKVTNGKMSGVMAFVILFLLGFIGTAIIQDSFNKVDGGAAVASGSTFSEPANSGVPTEPVSTPQAETTSEAPSAAEDKPTDDNPPAPTA